MKVAGVVVARSGDGYQVGDENGSTYVDHHQLAGHVAAIESASRPRWVWADTKAIYPVLLDAGVAVERCTDLRLCHRILRNAADTAQSALATAPDGLWDGPSPVDDDRPATLLDALQPTAATFAEALAEAALQAEAVAQATRPGALQLLLHAESAGALIAAEMGRIGLPWSVEIHRRALEDQLGPRPAHGQPPAALARLAEQIRDALDAPDLNPDSPTELLRALRHAGMELSTTRKWLIEQLDHPVREPLLRYKKLSRLHAANGWAWLDTWIVDGRFHPDYVPGGVVTGRWATRGGGALQLPKSLRRAVVADPGWRLVVSDAAQLEPRVLAAMSGDTAMAGASTGVDLYQAMVERGIVSTRQNAKIGMLAAMYGGTSGEAAVLLPAMRKAFPRALQLVDDAARAGERFERVSTWLGRTSPVPGSHWLAEPEWEHDAAANERLQSKAQQRARNWGRFTRNFVVQGTAAEWALCWMAGLRLRLRKLASAAGAAQLVYFLHDEVIVHTPAEIAEQVADAVHAAALDARRLMFADFDVEIPVTVDVVENYADA